MTGRWVFNASPLISLARSGHEDLLLNLPDEVVVPTAVASEVNDGPASDPARQALASGKFPFVEVHPQEEILAWDLGRGETAGLSHALVNPGWTAVLDDRAARKCARSFSIPHLGTLAVIIRARKHGMIASASQVMRSLQAAGFRLDEDVIRKALKETVEEEW